MPATLEPLRRPTSNNNSTWITSNSGNIYYRPRVDGSKKKGSNRNQGNANNAARFPRPLIEPRRSRPHAIHIVTYPPGYVPHELRSRAQSPSSTRARKIKVRTARAHRRISHSAASSQPVVSDPAPRHADRSPIRPALSKFLGSLYNPSTAQRIREPSEPTRRRGSTTTNNSQLSSNSASVSSLPAGISSSSSSSTPDSDLTRQGLESPRRQSADADLHSTSVGHAPSRNTTAATQEPSSIATTDAPPAACAINPTTDTVSRAAADFPTPTPRVQPRVRANTNTSDRRRFSMMSSRTANKSAISSLVSEVPKPVASGSGVACSILLAEPNIFLNGFDHDGQSRGTGQAGTALLRGKLQLNVSKNVKIKAIQLKLVGRARTEWPEGIPPTKQETFEETSLRTQVLTFFNVTNDVWETEYGNSCTYNFKDQPSAPYLVGHNRSQSGQQRHLSARDLKRLSLQNAQSRSFGKGDSGPGTPSAAAKGFKVFYPGVYAYSFELPIDHHQLETIKLQYGSVKWELQATVDRAGAFKPNLHGNKEVCVVRVPDQMSLEMTEPISISRQWEDQLHYDIIISGKSFPIGGKIPIAFKLTPLAKVQVHKLKVYVTESCEYWTQDRRVTRKDPGRKILLLEKAAGKPLDDTWASSDLRTVRGGELSQEQRRQARDQAAQRRAQEAHRRQEQPQPLPDSGENLLGDLDLGLESMWGATEIEANVQIPTCEMMAKNKDQRLHPDVSWKNVHVYHWIKIVMRISRVDPEDPTGTKRRHFEISIDSPFTVLNCRATQANTVLPAYGNISEGQTVRSCGCPDSRFVSSDPSPNSSTGTLNRMSGETMPALPQAAHLHDSSPMNPASETSSNEPRPIHLLRAPSFNPPAFDDDFAPPPAREIATQNIGTATSRPTATPPPQYDVVVGTPSVDGLADYFNRLADYGFPEDDSDSGSDDGPARILERSGRVNVANPRTPGGRMPSRSMEIQRPTISLNMDNVVTSQQRQAAHAV
ncbi:putative arrestin-related trafficking adapter protein-like protein [Emericellopsis cladophorae]|uniref:Arrestin-related trafficking adapter protein-like protein n=1 Tax=Emericellopsis cladophorae TaxID=2686198 RepID=A0A9Q0BD19_9HYPO|nr:putative arrestin-related trafficking adapter protein-like protein [Emericellopsis cladophorae]KAI6780110.1 putative arrestin-related trafficking adapter protein-like protein [Emericellopsis cladophorae]